MPPNPGFLIPGAVCVSSPVGTLTLNGVTINFLPTWGVLDASPLEAQLATINGKNRQLPGVRGTRPLQHYGGELEVVLPFRISGVCDIAGAAHSDIETGWSANIAYLMANVFDPALATPTIPLVYKGSLTGDAQVTGFDPVYKKHGLSGHTLSLLIAFGGLT